MGRAGTDSTALLDVAPRVEAIEVSNATALAELGLTREQLEAFDGHRYSRPRSFTLASVETPDGDPIVGLEYRCDYRAEEEWGMGRLAKTVTGDENRNFGMTEKGRAHVAWFSDGSGIILSDEPLPKQVYEWGEPISTSRWDEPRPNSIEDDYARFWQDDIWAGVRRELNLDYWAKVPELREAAKKLGIKPLPSKRDDLINAIAAAGAESLPREENDPGTFPGWFHDGHRFILRATDDSPTSRALKRLVRAAQDGTLGIGGSTAGNPFGRGFFIYETRDETPELNKEIDEAFAFHEAAMSAIEPVLEQLKSWGLRWYFVGNPRPSGRKSEHYRPAEPEGEIAYWVKGLRAEGYFSPSAELRAAFGDEIAQLFTKNDLAGWFTGSELGDKNFIVQRLHARIAERERWNKKSEQG